MSHVGSGPQSLRLNLELAGSAAELYAQTVLADSVPLLTLITSNDEHALAIPRTDEIKTLLTDLQLDPTSREQHRQTEWDALATRLVSSGVQSIRRKHKVSLDNGQSVRVNETFRIRVNHDEPMRQSLVTDIYTPDRRDQPPAYKLSFGMSRTSSGLYFKSHYMNATDQGQCESRTILPGQHTLDFVKDTLQLARAHREGIVLS